MASSSQVWIGSCCGVAFGLSGGRIYRQLQVSSIYVPLGC